MTEKFQVIPVDDEREAPVDVSTATPTPEQAYRYEPIAPPYTPTVEAIMEPTPSPTGTPVVPVSLVPILAAVVAIAGVGVVSLPAHTLAAKVCGAIVALGALLGVVSPGLRK